MRELGAAKVPMMLQSYVATLGASLPGIKEYKIFSVDGTGGTSLFGQNKPYFWGAIAITPNDAFPGALKYVKAKLPQVKRIGFIGWDLGPMSDIVVKNLQKEFAGTGYTQVADERTKVGATDYSATIQKVKAANPDIIFLSIYAEDVGYFMKQYATSGINKPVLGFTHSGAAAKIAGPAYDGLYSHSIISMPNVPRTRSRSSSSTRSRRLRASCPSSIRRTFTKTRSCYGNAFGASSRRAVIPRMAMRSMPRCVQTRRFQASTAAIRADRARSRSTSTPIR